MTLSDFLEVHKQKDLADLLRLTPGAINQMIKNKRDIRIVQHSDGSFSAFEVKPIGKAS